MTYYCIGICSVERSPVGVKSLHARVRDSVDLEACWVEVALTVRTGGGPCRGRVAVVAGAGVRTVCLGWGGSVPIPVDGAHQVVRGVPHGRKHG